MKQTYLKTQLTYNIVKKQFVVVGSSFTDTNFFNNSDPSAALIIAYFSEFCEIFAPVSLKIKHNLLGHIWTYK